MADDTDVSEIATATTGKVRAILAQRLSASEVELWAPRIAWALVLTVELVKTDGMLAALSHRQPMSTEEAVETGLTTLSRDPDQRADRAP